MIPEQYKHIDILTDDMEKEVKYLEKVVPNEALNNAIINKKYDMAHLLLEVMSKKEINFKKLFGLAILSNDVDFVYLISSFTKISNFDCQLFFENAIKNNNLDIIQFFDKSGFNISVNVDEWLEMSSEFSSQAAISYFLKRGANTHYNKCSSIKRSIIKHRFESTKILFESGCTCECIEDDVVCAGYNTNNVNFIGLMVLNNCDLNVNNGFPLINACVNGRNEVSEFMLKMGASPYVANSRPLKSAINTRKASLVKLILSYSKKLHYGYEDGLFNACKKNEYEIVCLLLKHNDKVTINKLQLMEVFKEGNIKIIELILICNLMQYEPLKEMFELAVEMKYDNIVKILLKNTNNIDLGNSKIFLNACKNGYDDIVEIFINSANSKLNKSFVENGVALSIQNNRIKIIDKLVERSVSIRKNSVSILNSDCTDSDIDVMNLLKKEGHDVGVDINSTFKIACLNKNGVVVKKLISHGIDLEDTTNSSILTDYISRNYQDSSKESLDNKKY
ncbi:putative ankyrin repeat protein [Smittium culicis]|uniref:Putative ankyrin repeat protein n=1 Tax=Smittium culicis TaxID=133412 RepID=A0A1R1YI25_9FUNG|nr:putative ankyrin repeat protein [Smittium culicis]